MSSKPAEHWRCGQPRNGGRTGDGQPVRSEVRKDMGLCPKKGGLSCERRICNS